MSRDVITVGSTMRIPLLYRGEYSQWRERFINYLEEQTDGEAMINSVQNGDQPLPVIAQVSLDGTAQNAPPTLKDPKFWTDEEKKTRKIDRLARSLLIQRLPNDIYSLIDSNKTAKDLWDALERQMRGSVYGDQDRKAAILYEYENFKANEGERQTKNLMDINIDALYNILKQNQGDVNDALGYKKKAVMVHSDPLALVAEKTNKITALLSKDFNRRKFHSKPTNNNLRTSSTSQSANKKQEFVKTNDKKVEKKANEKKRDMIKVKCYNCKKEGHFAKDCKKAKVKDYNYYKTKMLLAKKDNDEQVLLAEDQAWMESNESSSSAEETIAEVAYYTSESESESEFETLEYYDNSINYGLFVNNDDDQEIFHDAIESASENFIENHIDSQKDYDKSEVDHNDSEENKHLVDKLIRKFNHKIAKCKKRVEKANQQSKDFKNQNKDLQEKYDALINQQTSSLKPYVSNVILEKIIIDLEDEVVNLLEKEKANLETIESLKSKGFESSETAISELENQNENDCQVVEKECHKVKNPKVIAPGMFKLSVSQSVSPISMSKTSCDSKNVEIKLKRTRRFENPRYFEKAKDLRPSLYDKKVIGLGYTPMFLTHSDEALEIEKFKRSRENKIKFSYDYGNLIASYMNEKINFKDDYFQEIINLDFEKIDSPFQQTSSLKPYVPNVILEKIIIDLKDEVVNLLEKEKANLETIESLKKAKECDKVENPKLIAPGMFKLSVSQSVSPISISKTSCESNNVERETSSASVCNDAMNVSYNSRMCDFLDDNNLFIFDDESVRISLVSKMLFRKKPCDSLNIVQICLDHRFGMFKAYDGFGMKNCDTVPIPMVEQAKLKLDLAGKPVDHTDYRSMIRSLMYVT
nr:hypothetical protein [Tanacetum cinerariifolium]